ncbi:MAG: hypothetical protein QM660_13380 [Dysgonomonas sp.]
MENIKLELIIIAVPFIVAILGITFPMLLQTISRIDDKYNSTRIVETFNLEERSIWFKRLLIISIIIYFVSCITLTILLLVQSKLPGLNTCLFWLSIISVIILIIFLFLYAGLISEYYIPLRLKKRLSKSYDSLQKKLDANNSESENINGLRLVFFKAISELFYFSLKKQDEELIKELYSFYAEYILKIQMRNRDQIVSYDNDFYTMLFEATEIISSTKKKTISYANGNTLLQLLMDNNCNTTISEATYESIWRTLNQQLRFDRNDLIMSYWTYAHQYPQYFLQEIYLDRRYINNEFVTLNQDTVDKQNKKREDFFEFHYAFGGLILSEGKYKLLKHIVEYTNQQPPKYILVPSSLSEVIKKFILYSNDYMRPFYFESKYSFPNTSNINQNGIVVMWIQKYLAVLFLRQYIIPQTYGKNPLNLPSPPETFEDMNRWIENLNILKGYIKETLDNKELLHELELPMTSDNWFAEQKVSSPYEFIDVVIDETKLKYKQRKGEQEIDVDKKKEFKNITKEIIVNSINEVKSIFSENRFNQEIIYPLSLNLYRVEDKAAFTFEQDMGYMNFDSAPAMSVGMNYKYKSTFTFNYFIKSTYVLEQKNIFHGIDHLKLEGSKHVILCFGVNLDYYKDYLEIIALKKIGEKYYYKTIEVINLDYNMLGLENDSYIIIEKNGLPRVQFDMSESDLNLPIVDDTYHIKTDILDLHLPENKEIVGKINSGLFTKDPDLCVLVAIELDAKIIWNKEAKCIYIKTYQHFNNNTLPHSLNDIKPYN